MTKANSNVSETDTEKTAAAEINAAETEAATATKNETAPAPPPANARYGGITNFAYVGPSLPGGRLKSLTVLNGTYEQITDYYKETIALFPSVPRLIVPVASLAESRGKIEKGGNLLSKCYQELAAAIKPKGDEK